ncbi:MAG: nucleotidyltransferase family protein [Nitrospira sp.]
MARQVQEDVVILCGGLGTRLRSVVNDRPKPMALIQERPFLDFVIDHLVAQHFTRIIFSTGYQGDCIENHVSKRIDIDAVISQEHQPLGTAGALRACLPLISTKTVLVLNGDSLCRIHFQSLLAAHRQHAAVATLAVVPTNNRIDGGGLTLDQQGRILAFREKEAGPYINAGIYAIQTSHLEQITPNTASSLERDIFPLLAGHGLLAHISDAPLYDIGTPARLAAFQALQEEGSTQMETQVHHV